MSLAGAKAPNNCWMVCGTTEVVPCYKAVGGKDRIEAKAVQAEG